MLRTIATAFGLVLVCGCFTSGQSFYRNDSNVTSFEKLKYPALADTARITGAVVVRAKLDDVGDVVSASAITGHPMLMQGVLSNIQKWVFKPNSEKEVIIVYVFRLQGVCKSQRIVSRFDFEAPYLVSVTACQLHWNPQSAGLRGRKR